MSLSLVTHPTASASRPQTTTSAVTVEVTESNGALTVSDPELAITSGQTVEWSFAALGGDWVQAVHFVDQATNAITLGPFQSVRETGMLVLAEGNSGERGDYSYYVSAVRLDGEGQPTGEELTGGPFLVRNPLGEVVAGTLMGIQIQASLSDDGDLRLTARSRQESVTYHNGDILLFQFFGLPTGAVPEMIFESYTAADTATAPPNYQYGPFSSLTWIPSENLWVGSGESGSYGSWDFSIDLVVVDDEGVPERYRVAIEKGDDPVIDSEDYPVTG